MRYPAACYALMMLGAALGMLAPSQIHNDVQSRRIIFSNANFHLRSNLVLRGGADEQTAQPADEGPMDLNLALKKIRLDALGRVGCGLSKVYERVRKSEADVVVLAKDCDEASYGALLTETCAERSVPVIQGPDMQKLGELAGLVEYDKSGKVIKVRGTGAIVIKFAPDSEGSPSEAVTFLKKYIKKHGSSPLPKEDTKESGKAAETPKQPAKADSAKGASKPGGGGPKAGGAAKPGGSAATGGAAAPKAGGASPTKSGGASPTKAGGGSPKKAVGGAKTAPVSS